MTPLHQIKENACVKIVSLDAGKGLCRKLRNMGLMEGEIIHVVQNNKGPIIIGHGNLRFALGRGMSYKILVQTVDGKQCPIQSP